MSSLQYVGKSPDSSSPRGVQSRSQVETLLNSGITREYVTDRANVLSSGKATKSYVDSRDALYAETAYYTAQDALLVPNSSKAQPNGVASLDTNGKIPLAQTPVLGAGTLRGIYGVTNVFTGTTGTTPFKIAEWDLGVAGVNFKPWVFMSVNVDVANRGRPRIEVRIGLPTDTTYESQTLVAAGDGRAMYDDEQAVDVGPAPHMLSAMQDGIQTYYATGTSYKLTAWIFDTTGTGQITVASGQIGCASACLLRVVP